MKEIKTHNLETVILGALGIALLAASQGPMAHHLTPLAETFILIFMLGGLMGITHIRLPDTFGGKTRSVSQSVVASGVISAVMDSFLVLFLVKKDRLEGNETDKLRYRTYATLSALIGGLMLYFGEVYALPLALKYNMREWHSMLPIVPPVLIFLGILGVLASRLSLTLKPPSGAEVIEPTTRDHVEFYGFIALLLWTHNPLLVAGLLCFYASITGQGEYLIEVTRKETEMKVVLLLLIAIVAQDQISPYLSQLTGYWTLIPCSINGVVTGTMYPVTGNPWLDMSILSTGVLILPISSLVGVMLFTTAREWIEYVKISIPLTMLWFVIVTAWFTLVWPSLDPIFYEHFARPHL